MECKFLYLVFKLFCWIGNGFNFDSGWDLGNWSRGGEWVGSVFGLLFGVFKKDWKGSI